MDETTGSDEAASKTGIRAELRDAIAPRTVALVVGVLLLQLAFILSYVGAFHSPSPHRIPVGVLAPAQAGDQLIQKLNSLPDEPLQVEAVASESAGLDRLRGASLDAVLIVDPTTDRDRLLIASGAGSSLATAVQEVIGQVERAQHRSIEVHDVVPLQPGDNRGLTGFYLVIGWLVGGYLVAAALGVARGARPATLRRGIIRLVSLVPYSIVSGLGGALIVDQILGALNGHFVALWWLGALAVFGAATVTMAFEVLFGIVGIGIAVLIFVVLGNPSAGGAYQAPLLPPFWRALSDALPTGAATDSVRRIVYFGSHGITGHLIVLAVYAAAGAVVSLLTPWLIRRRAEQ